MKKYYSFALVALSAIAALSSCKKEFIEPEAVCADGPSFVAVIDEEAKTTIDGTKIYWKDGDEVSVNGKIFVAAVDPDNKCRAIFTLKAGETAPEASNQLYQIYYPATAYVANYPTRYKLGATQTFAGNDISGVNPMYAQVASLSDQVQFKNVCGLLAVKAKGTDKIASVTVTAPNQNYLYGTIGNFAYSEGAISYSSFQSSGRGTAVTLNCGTDGAQLKADEATTFYIALPEKSYTNLTIAFTTTSGKKKSFVSSKACPIVKNHIFGIPETLDFNVNFSANIEVTSNEAISAGVANLGFTVTPTDPNIYYVYCCESKAYVESFKGDDAALAAADIAFYKQQGASTITQLVNAGLATKGTKALTATATPGADMYIYAYGVDNDFNVSPAIKVPVKAAEFSLPVCSAQYSDYIGQWELGKDIITISEKVNGSTYNVTGIKNQESYGIPAIEASFENGNFVLNEQKTSATTIVNVSGLGEVLCDLYLSGVFTQSGKTYGYFPINSSTGTDPQMIFYGQYADDKITVNPGGCTYGSFIQMGFSWVIQSGPNAGGGSTYTGNTLADMTKAAKIDAQYSDYIGEWLLGNSIISISEKVNGSTYNVTGIYGQAENGIPAAEASFDNGKFIIKEQKYPSTIDHADYGTCEVYLSGQFSQSGRTYIYYPINSGTTSPSVLFSGIYTDSVINITPGSCNYGDFVGMTFCVKDTESIYYPLGSSTLSETSMTKYVAPTGPTPEGTWCCAEVTDKFGDTYTNWTITIAKSGAAFSIDGFDVAFDALVAAQLGHGADPAIATWDSEKSTLTVSMGYPTGISAGNPILWYGVDQSGNDSDIVLQFDLSAGTCVITNEWGAWLDEWWSHYAAGSCQFVKQEAAATSVKTPSINNSVRIKSVKELQRNFRKADVNHKGAEAATIQKFSCKKANINF